MTYIKETTRQLGYATQVAEKLAEMLAECDDEDFNPVAYELAEAVVNRIRKACEVLDAEDRAINDVINDVVNKQTNKHKKEREG